MYPTASILWAAPIVVLSAAGVMPLASPAPAGLVEPAGSCVVRASWTNGGFTVDSATADPNAVIVIPRADSVAWTAKLARPLLGTQRQISGSLAVDLPAPLGTLVIDQWSGPSSKVTNSGVRTYDLPSLVPAGVVFKLRGDLHENGTMFCTGTASLRIAGGPLRSPLAWISLGLTALFGVLLLLAGRFAAPRAGHLILGAGLGLPFGALLGVMIVMLGVSTLDGPLPATFAVVGAAGGAAWSRSSPLRRTRRPA